MIDPEIKELGDAIARLTTKEALALIDYLGSQLGIEGPLDFEFDRNPPILWATNEAQIAASFPAS